MRRAILMSGILCCVAALAASLPAQATPSGDRSTRRVMVTWCEAEASKPPAAAPDGGALALRWVIHTGPGAQTPVDLVLPGERPARLQSFAELHPDLPGNRLIERAVLAVPEGIRLFKQLLAAGTRLALQAALATLLS